MLLKIETINFKLYLTQDIDYYDIIPQMMMEFRRKFDLNGRCIGCFSSGRLRNNKNWIEYCKNTMLDNSNCTVWKESTQYDNFDFSTLESPRYPKTLYEGIYKNRHNDFLANNDYVLFPQGKKISQDVVLAILKDSKELEEFIDQIPNYLNFTDIIDLEKSGWYYSP